MGFYIRKSVSVGPFRFNLSKSGIGVSTGIKGFRIGSGPRGNYVHMGRGGVYFRQTLPSTRKTTDERENIEPEFSTSEIEFQAIESGDIRKMTDSSSTALLEEISSKANLPRIWPWVLGIGITLIIFCVRGGAPLWICGCVAVLCAAASAWALHADTMRKTVVLFYELEPHIEDAYRSLHAAVDLWHGCSQIGQVMAIASFTDAYDRKMNAGASSLSKLKRVNRRSSPPAYFKCNLSIPVLPGVERSLYLLPDRILVWENGGIGSVGFEDFELRCHNKRVAVPGGVPSDAVIVDKTWRYVNKKGGPDKRFKDNEEIPIVLYEEVSLTSKTGLNEMFYLSRTAIATTVREAVQRMAAAIKEREETQSDFIKCPCMNCDVTIEFPRHWVGRTVVCPRCEMETVLFKRDNRGDG